MSARRPWRPQLTPSEQRQGWVFFALYLLVFPILLPTLLNLLDSRLDLYAKSAAMSNAVYYLIIVVLLLAVFFSFLKHGFFLLLDWLPENLFALGTGLLFGGALTVLVGFIPLPAVLPILQDYPQQFALSPGATVAVVVFLRPIAEEILFRGLLFGSLRKWSRPLGYLLSTVLFALFSVWQFAFPSGQLENLLLIVRYLPIGLALTWSYDNGGSVWSPILLRMLFSGISLGLMLHL